MAPRGRRGHGDRRLGGRPDRPALPGRVGFRDRRHRTVPLRCAHAPRPPRRPCPSAAVVADTPFPAFPAARIGTGTVGVLPFGTTVPVLASPSAAAVLGPGATQLTSLSPMGPVKVRVAGTLSSTPAQPGDVPFVVM